MEESPGPVDLVGVVLEKGWGASEEGEDGERVKISTGDGSRLPD